MATAGEMCDGVAAVLKMPPGTVASYYRRIREGGLIEQTGRGRSAALVSALDEARLLIAILWADQISQAADRTRQAGSFPLVSVWDVETEEHFIQDPFEAPSLEAALAELLDELKHKNYFDFVKEADLMDLEANFHQNLITLRRGNEQSTYSDEPQSYEGGIEISRKIRGHDLYQISKLLLGPRKRRREV